MTALNIPTLPIPTLEDRENARISSRTLSNYGSQTLHIRIDEKDSTCVLPGSVVKLLADMLHVVAEGQSVAVLPIQSDLTLHQAAEILDVSVPYLAGLLDDGEIPYRTEGNRRIMKLQDILDYESRNIEERKAVLAELVADAQELNMGY